MTAGINSKQERCIQSRGIYEKQEKGTHWTAKCLETVQKDLV